MKNQIKYGICRVVQASVYTKWLKRNGCNAAVSAVISMFLCILSYPGIIYSDSYGRIGFADTLKMSLHAFFTGNAGLHEVNSWLTVTPSFFILLSKEIVGSIVLYTFFQCMLFFFMVMVFTNNLNMHKYMTWNRACVLLSPVIWAFGVYYEAGVGCVTAIMAILLLIWKWDTMVRRFDQGLTLLFLALCSFICFGYRANAFTILPALFLAVILKEKKRIAGAVLLAAISIGFFASVYMPKVLHINTMSSYAAGFAWEIVSAIQSMGEEKRADYIGYMDDIFGEGATAAAVSNNSYAEQGSSINAMFQSPIHASAISEPGNAGKIIRKYIRLAKNEPREFIRMKWEFVSHSLGIGKPVNMFEYNYNRWDRMHEFGFNDSYPRKVYVGYFLAFMEFMVCFKRPWMLYLTGFILIVVWRVRYVGVKSPIHLYEAAYGVSVFYYGAYLLNTQSFEFRYFFPSWLLLFLIITALGAEILFAGKKRNKIAILAFLGAVAICFLGGYQEYIKNGDETIDNVKSAGTILYEDTEHYVIYYDNKLYFISGRNADNGFSYFLHYMPDSADMINNDFIFRDYALPTAFWKEKVAVRDIPKQPLQSVAFGQYYGDTRFWESSADVSDFINCPERIIVSDYTDDHWQNGYSKTENIFLLEDLGIANYLLTGKAVVMPDQSIVKIIKVEEVSGYLRVYTDVKIHDASIREFKVVET